MGRHSILKSGAIVVDGFNKLYTPPKPTLLDPHAQIKWIFSLVESEYDEPTAANFRYAKNKYIEFLTETNAYYPELQSNTRFYLEKYWEADALIRFNKWLLLQSLTSKTRYGLYKNVRYVMDMGYSLRIIDTIVYHAPMFKGVSETKERAAYARREQEVVNAAVAKWIGLANSILCGYQATGEGIPYRRKNDLLPIIVDGHAYSISEAAKTFGVEHGNITKYLKQGWTARQAVGLDPSPKVLALACVVDGEVFHNKEAVAKRFGISGGKIWYRIKQGWTMEQVVGLSAPPEKEHSNITCKPTQTIVDGLVFESIRAAAAHFSVDYKVVKNRLWIGWTIREALGLDQRQAYGAAITVEGVAYLSVSAAAKAYGLERGGVSNRLRRGLSTEQAFGIVPINVPQSDDRALLWMFENMYGCDAHAMREDFQKRRGALSRICSMGRLLKLFVRWGVWPTIDDRLMLPLAVEMAMLTGLNVEALRFLDVDSFELEHRLTGQPVITYRKKRSGSAKRSENRELHLPILELEELYLNGPVVEKIIRLLGLILALTSKIRADAPPELARRLFIFEDVELSRKTGTRVVVPIEPAGKTATWYSRFCREEGLYEVFGEEFNFNMSRCRPTLATNMVLGGASLFQVQAALGHESIQTTATYLDGHQMRPAFNRTISEALERISKRSLEFQKDPSSVECLSPNVLKESEKGGFHETLSGCGCVNPYRPSEHVRSLTKLSEGAVCKYWNMCLLCDNAFITENSLPKLILYRDRVAAALDEDSPAIQTRKGLYQDVLKLIDGILESDVIFPSSVIDSARYVAATMDDLMVDQLVYQGV